VSESVLRYRGIAAKLSVALLAVNLVALAIVYSGTAHSLGKRLVAAREAALLRDAYYQRRIYENAPLDPCSEVLSRRGRLNVETTPRRGPCPRSWIRERRAAVAGSASDA
jgi:hypothetical protein